MSEELMVITDALDAVYRETQIARQFIRQLVAIASTARDGSRLLAADETLNRLSTAIEVLPASRTDRPWRSRLLDASAFSAVTNGDGSPSTWEELREGLDVQLSHVMKLVRLAPAAAECKAQAPLQELAREIESLRLWARREFSSR